MRRPLGPRRVKKTSCLVFLKTIRCRWREPPVRHSKHRSPDFCTLLYIYHACTDPALCCCCVRQPEPPGPNQNAPYEYQMDEEKPSAKDRSQACLAYVRMRGCVCGGGVIEWGALCTDTHNTRTPSNKTRTVTHTHTHEFFPPIVGLLRRCGDPPTILACLDH